MNVNPNVPLWAEDTVEIMGLRLWLAGWRAARAETGFSTEEVDALEGEAHQAAVALISSFTPGNEAERLGFVEAIVTACVAIDPHCRNDHLRMCLLDALLDRLGPQL